MIRINLLGTAKPKKGKGRGRLFNLPKLTHDGPSPLFTGLGILVLAGAGFYVYYQKLEHRHEQLQVEITDASREIASLTRVKQAYLARQKEYDAVKRRFDIIDQLRAQQTGPVPMLNTISDTVNATDGIWLLNLHDDGATVSLDGVALGPDAVADLMTKLRRSGYFKDVELKDTVQQDDVRKLQTFSFSVVCEKAKA
jgi:type IV pilus assembly protein PilN